MYQPIPYSRDDYERAADYLNPPKPDDYTESPDGVDCAACDGAGDLDMGDGSAASPDRVGPQIVPCSACYGTGRVPEPERWEAWATYPDPHGGDDLADEWLGDGFESEEAARAALDARFFGPGWKHHVSRT